MNKPRMIQPFLARVERGVRWAWNYASTFGRNIGRRNEYYWPGERAGIDTAHTVARAIALGCDGVWYANNGANATPKEDRP